MKIAKKIIPRICVTLLIIFLFIPVFKVYIKGGFYTDPNADEVKYIKENTLIEYRISMIQIIKDTIISPPEQSAFKIIRIKF